MTSYLRPLPLAAGLLLLTAVTSANPAPATPRIDDDTHFADWLSAVPSATDPDLYEVDAGRTFAPERLREVDAALGLHDATPVADAPQPVGART